MRDTLAPNRMEIINALAGQGPLAISEVARRVGRDVQAVHRDVTRLTIGGATALCRGAEPGCRQSDGTIRLNWRSNSI